MISGHSEMGRPAASRFTHARNGTKSPVKAQNNSTSSCSIFTYKHFKSSSTSGPKSHRHRRNISASPRGTALLSFLLFMAAFVINSESRSFSLLGCLGEYDISKFAELDRICEDCYQVYREPELNLSCR